MRALVYNSLKVRHHRQRLKKLFQDSRRGNDVAQVSKAAELVEPAFTSHHEKLPE